MIYGHLRMSAQTLDHTSPARTNLMKDPAAAAVDDAEMSPQAVWCMPFFGCTLPSGKRLHHYGITIFDGKTNYKYHKWPYSIAMLNYQRVICLQLSSPWGSVVSDGDNNLEVGGCQVWIRWCGWINSISTGLPLVMQKDGARIYSGVSSPTFFWWTLNQIYTVGLLYLMVIVIHLFPLWAN